ncbi:MAG: YggU family protein [Gammaproteobacteria bacterium]|nr:YggU family protein [Gammaproteobacteria bacterium]
MRQQASWYRWEAQDLLLNLRIHPRASQDQFVAPLGDCYKVSITAPPVEGKANTHLIAFLADSFGVNRRQVRLVTGANSRNKGVRITNPQRIPAALSPL